MLGNTQDVKLKQVDSGGDLTARDGKQASQPIAHFPYVIWLPEVDSVRPALMNLGYLG